MADWTNIPNESLEPDAPVRSIDGLAFRDNPIAIAEGAAGAPRIDGAISPALRNGGVPNGELGAEKFKTTNTERDWVLARTSGAALGSLGSYGLLRNTSSSAVSPGGTISGGSLIFANAAGGGTAGSAPAGTWRAMGNAQTSPADMDERTTVFLRIS